MTRVSMFGYLGGQAKVSGQLRGGGGGGGDHVSITPVLTSGAKIADYEINGEAGELYCIKSYNDLDDKPTIPPAPTGMVGASAGSDGTAGYVPQPVAGDEGKVLYGDGTWKSLDNFKIIDVNNIIQAFTIIQDTLSHDYIATEDCAIVYSIAGNANTGINIKIDDIICGGGYCASLTQMSGILYLKKNQKFTFEQTYIYSTTTGYTVYGLK